MLIIIYCKLLEITVLFSRNFCWICRWSVLNPIGDVNVRYWALALLSFLTFASPEPVPFSMGFWSSCCGHHQPRSPRDFCFEHSGALYSSDSDLKSCGLVSERAAWSQESQFYITGLDLLVWWQCVCGWWFGVLVGEGWGHFDGELLSGQKGQLHAVVTLEIVTLDQKVSSPWNRWLDRSEEGVTVTVWLYQAVDLRCSRLCVSRIRWENGSSLLLGAHSGFPFVVTFHGSLGVFVGLGWIAVFMTWSWKNCKYIFTCISNFSFYAGV